MSPHVSPTLQKYPNIPAPTPSIRARQLKDERGYLTTLITIIATTSTNIPDQTKDYTTQISNPKHLHRLEPESEEVTKRMPDLHSLPPGSRPDPSKVIRNNGSSDLALERFKLRELAEGWPMYRDSCELENFASIFADDAKIYTTWTGRMGFRVRSMSFLYHLYWVRNHFLVL